ncbi:hypothetical protein MRX96_058234 [Rhipicephalus microplus]
MPRGNGGRLSGCYQGFGVRGPVRYPTWVSYITQFVQTMARYRRSDASFTSPLSGEADVDSRHGVLSERCLIRHLGYEQRTREHGRVCDSPLFLGRLRGLSENASENTAQDNSEPQEGKQRNRKA